MRKRDLPKGVSYDSHDNITSILKSEVSYVEMAFPQRSDLRIFHNPFRVWEPHTIQAIIEGEWRELKFSNGQGRHPSRGFATLDLALTECGKLLKHLEAINAPVTGIYEVDIRVTITYRFARTGFDSAEDAEKWALACAANIAHDEAEEKSEVEIVSITAKDL